MDKQRKRASYNFLTRLNLCHPASRTQLCTGKRKIHCLGTLFAISLKYMMELFSGDLCFHRVHGHNVRVQGVGLVATRIASMVNFEDALVFSSRPLRECEMFQVRVCEILPLWDTCVAIGIYENTIPSNDNRES